MENYIKGNKEAWEEAFDKRDASWGADIVERISNEDYPFFNEDTNAQVTFSVEKERQKIEVTIPMKGHIIRAEQVSDDMYVSIDMVVEIIERQVTRYKKRIIDQEQDAAFFQNQFLEEEDDIDDDISIIRSKRFAVKPMYPEDACVQMELLGHSFYVFRNAETDEVNVVYKRKGNTYGLIEPEF